jgi:hypothetical protein
MASVSDEAACVDGEQEGHARGRDNVEIERERSEEGGRGEERVNSGIGRRREHRRQKLRSE